MTLKEIAAEAGETGGSGFLAGREARPGPGRQAGVQGQAQRGLLLFQPRPCH